MIKPLADRVVIKPSPVEDKTSSGLIIPDNAKERPLQGKIVAVGIGTRKISEGNIETVTPLEVEVDDIVLYGKYSGTEVKIEEEDYLIMRESEILAIIQ